MKDKNFLGDIYYKARLTIQLMLDKRVAIYLKVIPLAGIVYVVVPDIVIGPIDDAAVLAGAVQLFISLCPSEIVNEHERKIGGNSEPISEDTIEIIEK